jgi:two-component system cell cycle response regulator
MAKHIVSHHSGAEANLTPLGQDVWDVDKLKLLIIEDDPDQRELICETVEDHFGAGVTQGVASRAEALKEDLGRFDLILSDYNLPDATGMQMLEDIRQRCDTPIIMVTGENVGQTAADAINRGATDYVVKFGDYLFTIPLIIQKNLTVAKIKRDNARLQAELQTALREVRDKNVQLEQSLQRVEQMAATDPLTGLYNRRHFSKVIDQMFAEAQRHEKDLSCVMIDLDGYKQLNDKWGHQVGDQMLQVAAKAIGNNLRRSDVAARYGGDEFVILLPHADVEQAYKVAQRIAEQFVAMEFAMKGQDLGVTMSIGISSLVGGVPPAADQLVAQADKAMYSAKAQGKNRIVRDLSNVCEPVAA